MTTAVRWFLLAAACTCVSAGTAPGYAQGGKKIAMLRVTPESLTVNAGDIAQARCIPLTQRGDSLKNTCAWKSTDTTVVRVTTGSQTSTLTARRNGVVTISASAGGKSASLKVTVAGTAPPPPPPDTTPPPPPPPVAARLYGFHMDITYYGAGAFKTTAIQQAQAIHAKVSRNTLPWYVVEGTKGTRDWTKIDDAVNGLTAVGIQPLLIFGTSPAWANGNSDPWVVPATGPAFDQWLVDYQTFITTAVTRYKDRVHLWELWNEENEIYFWKPQPNAAQYARFYTMGYNAVKAVDPTAQVALGGLAGVVVGCCISGLNFLDSLAVRGIHPAIVNIHPYALDEQAPDNHIPYHGNFDDIAAVRAKMVAMGDGAKPMWVTEWGWKTPDAAAQTRVAGYVTKSLQMIDSLYPYVTLATYFMEFDNGGYTQGLYTNSWVAKPAAAAFSAFAVTH